MYITKVFNLTTCYYLHNQLMDWHETTIESCEQGVKDIWKIELRIEMQKHAFKVSINVFCFNLTLKFTIYQLYHKCVTTNNCIMSKIRQFNTTKAWDFISSIRTTMIIESICLKWLVMFDLIKTQIMYVYFVWFKKYIYLK
jgi:hypothetical protein